MQWLRKRWHSRCKHNHYCCLLFECCLEALPVFPYIWQCGKVMRYGFSLNYYHLLRLIVFNGFLFWYSTLLLILWRWRGLLYKQNIICSCKCMWIDFFNNKRCSYHIHMQDLLCTLKSYVTFALGLYKLGFINKFWLVPIVTCS